MEQTWRQAKAAFAAIAAPPIVWLALFFFVPMAVIWAYSFGENVGPITIDFTGTFANYGRALEPLYLEIFWKSLVVAGLTTVLCLIIGFPVALAIAFASPKTKAWLLLLIMLPFWTNLLIRTFALIAVLRENGYVNSRSNGFGITSGLMSLVGLQPLGDFEPVHVALQQHGRGDRVGLRASAHSWCCRSIPRSTVWIAR
jgi:spermidine/putrescine transport system permease protein